MPLSKLTRREREKQRQHNEILDGALELFAKKGFHNVSMHEIAGKTEFAIGTLYKFFNNKEALYKALMIRESKKFHTAIGMALESKKDPYTRIRDYVKAKSEVFRDNINVVRLYFAETSGASFNIKSGLESEIKQRYEISLQKIGNVFKEGIQKGIFRDLDPFHLAVSIDSLSNAFLFMCLEKPDKFSYDMNLVLLDEIFFKGIADSNFHSLGKDHND